MELVDFSSLRWGEALKRLLWLSFDIMVQLPNVKKHLTGVKA